MAIGFSIGQTVPDNNQKHAVTAMGSNTFSYDANGNQTNRTVGGSSYTLSYDAENRLVSVSGAATASFVYDGDGNRTKNVPPKSTAGDQVTRVKGTIGTTTTTYISNYFEWKTSTSDMNIKD